MLSRLVILLALVSRIFCSDLSIVVTAVYPADYPTYLRGSGCGLNWDKGVKMSFDKSSSSYTTTVKCTSAEIAASSILEVKTLINDNQWMIGSNHHISLAGQVGEAQDQFYPWYFQKKGTLTTIKRVYSPQLNNTRDVIFYLPPSFTENTLKPYSNVLVMHDGQNLFDPKTSAFGTAWMAQDTFDSTIVSGASDEVLVIGPYNTADRIDEYTYIYDPSEGAGGKGDLYLDWIQDTLLPFVLTQNMRIELNRDTLGILGSSLGGLISCYAGWTRSSVYGKVGCMSSSFWWDDNDFQYHMMPEHTVPADPKPHIYMDSGTGSVGEVECTLYTQQIEDIMVKDGFSLDSQVKTYVDPGAVHNEAYWGKRFYLPVEFLYPHNTV